MNRLEALAALIEGKKVRAVTWEKHKYLKFDKGNFDICDQDERFWYELADFKDYEYEIYKEKVKKYNVLYKYSDDDGEWVYETTGRKYANKHEFNEEFDSYNNIFIQLIGNSVEEFEE